jgi:hypothetical protein
MTNFQIDEISTLQNLELQNPELVKSQDCIIKILYM